MVLIQVLIILVLLAIFIQDLKSRSVYWFCFPALIGLFVILGLQTRLPIAILESSIVNIGFIALQLVLVSAYFSVRQKRLVNITQGLLGWGDILFLLSLCFYLSTLNFILFYVLSLVLIVFIWILAVLFYKKDKEIPLAGLQSVIFIVCLVLDWSDPVIDLLHDDWLMHYLF